MEQKRGHDLRIINKNKRFDKKSWCFAKLMADLYDKEKFIIGLWSTHTRLGFLLNIVGIKKNQVFIQRKIYTASFFLFTFTAGGAWYL